MAIELSAVTCRFVVYETCPSSHPGDGVAPPDTRSFCLGYQRQNCASNKKNTSDTLWFTPPKINMEHNNGGLEDDFPFQIGDF